MAARVHRETGLVPMAGIVCAPNHGHDLIAESGGIAARNHAPPDLEVGAIKQG